MKDLDKKILKSEVDRLIIEQQHLVEKNNCPYSDILCNNPKDWNCEVPIFGGKGHDKIIGRSICPLYKGKW